MRALVSHSRLERRTAPRLEPIALALLAVLGCASEDPARPGPTSEALGTPLTAANAVDVASPLYWSSSTGELICAESFLSASGGLMAVHATTMATRVLDARTSIAVDVAPDGSAVYYNAFGGAGPDYALARRLPLAGSFAPAVLDSCSLLCVYFMVAAPDGDHVAVTDVTDSLRIHVLSTGEKTGVGVGIPLAFSPASDRILVNEPFAPLDQAAIVTVATGSAQPAGLGVPYPIAGSKVRWGPSGIEVLYLAADEKRFFLHRAATGTTTLIWASPDTLSGSIAWSPSGSQAAIWSSRQAGTAAAPARRWELHVIDLLGRIVRTVAYAEVPTGSTPVSRSAARLPAIGAVFFPGAAGGLVFSADEAKLAYTFFDGRVYRSGL